MTKRTKMKTKTDIYCKLCTLSENISGLKKNNVNIYTSHHMSRYLNKL